MKRLTLKEWNALGYRVGKGERCVGKNKNGEALFLESQVYDPPYEGEPDDSDLSFGETQDMGFWG